MNHMIQDKGLHGFYFQTRLCQVWYNFILQFVNDCIKGFCKYIKTSLCCVHAVELLHHMAMIVISYQFE